MENKKCPVCSKEYSNSENFCTQCAWELKSEFKLGSLSANDQEEYKQRIEIAQYKWRESVNHKDYIEDLKNAQEDMVTPNERVEAGVITFQRAVRDDDLRKYIYTINVDGLNEKNLTSNQNCSYSQVWSPNGKIIAFLSLGGKTIDGLETNQVCIVQSDGSDFRELTDFQALNGTPAWSLDSRYLFFTSSFWTGKEIIVSLHKVNINNNIIQELYGPCVFRIKYYPLFGLIPYDQFVKSITVSPSGKSIFFIWPVKGYSEIMGINYDGSGCKKITNLKADCFYVSHSPLSDYLLLKTMDGFSLLGDKEILYIMKVGSIFKNVNKVKQRDNTMYDKPTWHLDGSKICYSRKHMGYKYVCVMDVKGKENILREGEDPSWSPSCNFIIYSDADGLKIMNLEGQIIKKLTDSRTDIYPMWQPKSS